MQYGNLLPQATKQTIAPFEFFELYAAANVFNSSLQGVQVHATGLLHGWSYDVSDDRFTRRDNDVLGVAMTYEFQGVNLATYGGAGIGPANYLILRFGKRRSLRLGLGADVVPVLGVTPNEPRPTDPGYNFGSGVAGWAAAALDLARWGQLRVRSRHHVTTVLDGSSVGEYLGATRASYEVDLIEHVGVGFAPRLIQRRSLSPGDDSTSTQLETQLYLRMHN